MRPWIEFLTRLLNHWLAGPVDALLRALHIHPASTSRPIGATLVLELIIFALLVFFFILVRATLSVEKPGSAQHLAEVLHEFVSGQAEQVMGHGYEPFLPVLTCILAFILLCNCFGLLPGIETPTSNPVVPLGLALFTFVYYNVKGLWKHGPIGYVKHFMGPVWWIAPLMFPIEIISHLARILSLTVRLFANMLASDLITVIFFSMIPLALPIVGLGLHAFVALIQAYIFMLLATIYLGEATAHAESH
ncbi:MAG TPA: F0F1 ATP synthase subunit A [Acidobacteriaceae bacterium]